MARTGPDPSLGYTSERYPEQDIARKIVNPRRGISKSVPGLDFPQAFLIGDTLFREFNLEQYEGCVTGEMMRRPVPHVFKPEGRALEKVFERWAPRIYHFLFRNIKPPIQAYNRTSRLGWPYFRASDHKRALLLEAFSQLDREGVALFDKAFIIMNVRLQAEDKSKKREFIFVTAGGKPYTSTVGVEDRTLDTEYGPRIGSRTRLVFNLPFGNLYKQVLDTAIHNALLEHPVFHHDLYTPGGTTPVRGRHLCFDVRHFERHTATICRLRGRLLGGLYALLTDAFARAPFLVPSDDWAAYYLLRVNRDAGWSDQFASGDSAVAPVQKEIFLALYSEFAVEHLGMQEDEAFRWVLGAGDDRLTIRNYGDDNSVSGDTSVVDDLFSFMGKFLTVEEEDPPKFLGFRWTDQGWRLGPDSYLTKTYLNERRPFSTFRAWPYFGWMEKRKIYAQYGVPEITRFIYARENDLLEQIGLPWQTILRRALVEGDKLQELRGPWENVDFVLGKEWKLSAREKINTGLFDGLYPEETAPMIGRLIGDEWKGVVPWISPRQREPMIRTGHP